MSCPPAPSPLAPRLRMLFCLMAEARGLRSPGQRGELLAGVPDDELAGAAGALAPLAALPTEALGNEYERALGDRKRRASGSHYTAPALARAVVEAALAPLRLEEADPAQILALRLCDPAMGAGAFLLEGCRQLSGHLLAAWRRAGAPRPAAAARREVALRCLRGVDQDPQAAELARLSLWLEVGDPGLPLDFADNTLRTGDALAGPALDFSKIPGESGVFDVFVGNPPWVSYAGRAAQPLGARRRELFAERYESFRGYRNLQGLFVERCARLLRPGGRLGLVLPSSMAELGGYAPTRVAHDRYCACDPELRDIGEKAFENVFQPSMILLSTRRPADREAPCPDPWPLERPDLDPATRALLARLAGPPLPPHLFGERGLQTSGPDLEHLQKAPDEAHTEPLRAGADVRPFALGAPSLYAAPGPFGPRLRTDDWRAVKVLIRQTARFPVAALSDGGGFRNSLLAGFEDDEHPATFLVAYLNATPIRWAHYLRHRDARQGMPQLKIGHLRSLPAPPDRGLIPRLSALGAALSGRNQGASPDDQRALDDEVGRAFSLSPADLDRMRGQLPPG